MTWRFRVPPGAVFRGPGWQRRLKGAKEGRWYRIPRAVLREIAGYNDPLEGSRSQAISRARRRGAYEKISYRRVVRGHNARSRLLYLEGGGSQELTAFFLLLTASTAENSGTVASWPAVHHRPDGGVDVYGDHKGLVDAFRARVRAQKFTPQVVQSMAEENIVLREALAKIKTDLSALTLLGLC